VARSLAMDDASPDDSLAEYVIDLRPPRELHSPRESLRSSRSQSLLSTRRRPKRQVQIPLWVWVSAAGVLAIVGLLIAIASSR
jgi:hypothetical protein